VKQKFFVLCEKKNLRNLEIPRDCPSCQGKGCLNKHGSYSRKIRDLAGNEQKIFIQRLRCRGCRTSFSCLYDFLIQYRKYTVDVFEQAVQTYLTCFCSYAQALWSNSQNETAMAASTLFRLIAAMTAQIWLSKQQLQSWLIQAGIEASNTDRAFCPNASKAKSITKAQRLNSLAKLVAQASDIFSSSPIFSLHQLFLTKTEHIFSFLNARNNLRLSYPHSVQLVLF
jgi:transposase-like protein